MKLLDLVNSVIIFLSQMTLLRWLTFLLGSQTVILIVLLFWIYFFLLTLVFVLQWLPSIGKFWSCCCLGFHWLSITFTMRWPILLHCLWLFSCWLEWSFWLFERCSMGWFELGASTAASEFSEWVQVEIDAYITHRKYQGQASLIFMIFSYLCCCHSS